MTESPRTEPLPTVSEARADLLELRRRSLLYAGIVIVLAAGCAFFLHQATRFAFLAAAPLLYVGATSARLRALRGRSDNEPVADSDLDLKPVAERLMKMVGIVLALGMLLTGIVVCAVIVMHT